MLGGVIELRPVLGGVMQIPSPIGVQAGVVAPPPVVLPVPVAVAVTQVTFSFVMP